MPTIIKIRQSKIDKASAVSPKLRKKFDCMNIHLDDEQITDIRDIYEICSIYTSLIDKLVSEKTTDRDVFEILRNVNKDLYIHLPYHCKNLKKRLRKVVEKYSETIELLHH